MKYVEMILSIDDANIIQFPSLLDRVVKWKEQGIKFIRMVTDAIRPSEVIHLSGTSNKQHVSTKLTFNDIYDAIKQPTEQNFTILKSLYNKVDSEIILKIINTPICSNNKYIKQLLQQSNGYMIYQHQMHQFIVDKMEYSITAAIELTNDWNKKVIKQRELLIQCDDYYLIENKMPQYFLFTCPE